MSLNVGNGEGPNVGAADGADDGPVGADDCDYVGLLVDCDGVLVGSVVGIVLQIKGNVFP